MQTTVSIGTERLAEKLRGKLERCDGVLWDGWTGTGPRDVHGLMLDEAAIGTQLCCESCRNNPTSKKGLESKYEPQGTLLRNDKPRLLVQLVPLVHSGCAVTHELFDLVIELCPSSMAGTLAENIQQLHLPEYNSLNPLRAFSDPYNIKEYNARPISHDMVSKIFQEFVSAMQERESEEYLRTLSGISISFDNTFHAAMKATITNQEKQKSKVLKGGIISLMNENNEIVGWCFCHAQSNAEITSLQAAIELSQAKKVTADDYRLHLASLHAAMELSQANK
ncbi:uncharacterized protein EDB93DRAFT_1099792 [Suillus bovinus]|uniref:uncharacterized protein n=1 Tax=Suillus bovinus TaxID=48563 RepID=UPI001B862F90|nr:uncharacterized protein EDB93DRAFT_1099792 [Suillus bovinus]KAG2159431.1 hypothetical protein EDB93DRAFT_1099792 [Suillus bovinus]